MAIENTYSITVKLMQKGLTLTRQLYALLVEEAEVLNRRHHAELLTNLSDQKHQLVTELNQFTLHISQILSGENLPTGNVGIKVYCDKLEAADIDSKEINTLWSEISSLSENCQLLNEQNGASIDLLTRHVQRSMQILNGELQASNTYGPNGVKTNDCFSHTLASV